MMRKPIIAPTPGATLYVPGPVFARVCTFGDDEDGMVDGVLMLGSFGPDPLPAAVRKALMEHVRRGDRIVVLTQTEEQMDAVRAEVASQNS